MVEEENAGHERQRRVKVLSSLRFLVSAPPVGLYPSVHEQSKDTDADALQTHGEMSTQSSCNYPES